MSRIRCYTELKQLKTFEERFEYLKIPGSVGFETFGVERYLNQRFYQSDVWQAVRRKVILRDNGCDLGISGRELETELQIHHMNPITKDDIIEQSEFLLNPEYLICVSARTHKAIHYGNADGLIRDPVERRPNDTCPGRN